MLAVAFLGPKASDEASHLNEHLPLRAFTFVHKQANMVFS